MLGAVLTGSRSRCGGSAAVPSESNRRTGQRIDIASKAAVVRRFAAAVCGGSGKPLKTLMRRSVRRFCAGVPHTPYRRLRAAYGRAQRQKREGKSAGSVASKPDRSATHDAQSAVDQKAQSSRADGDVRSLARGRRWRLPRSTTLANVCILATSRNVNLSPSQPINVRLRPSSFVVMLAVLLRGRPRRES
jgi:hypothetical protein